MFLKLNKYGPESESMTAINTQQPKETQETSFISNIFDRGSKLTQGFGYALLGTASLTAGVFLMYSTGMSV